MPVDRVPVSTAQIEVEPQSGTSRPARRCATTSQTERWFGLLARSTRSRSAGGAAGTRARRDTRRCARRSAPTSPRCPARPGPWNGGGRRDRGWRTGRMSTRATGIRCLPCREHEARAGVRAGHGRRSPNRGRSRASDPISGPGERPRSPGHDRVGADLAPGCDERVEHRARWSAQAPAPARAPAPAPGSSPARAGRSARPR